MRCSSYIGSSSESMLIGSTSFYWCLVDTANWRTARWRSRLCNIRTELLTSHGGISMCLWVVHLVPALVVLWRLYWWPCCWSYCRTRRFSNWQSKTISSFSVATFLLRPFWVRVEEERKPFPGKVKFNHFFSKEPRVVRGTNSHGFISPGTP